MSEIKDVLEITAEIPDDLLDGIYLKAHLLGLYSLKIMANREEQQKQIDAINEQSHKTAKIHTKVLMEADEQIDKLNKVVEAAKMLQKIRMSGTYTFSALAIADHELNGALERYEALAELKR